MKTIRKEIEHLKAHNNFVQRYLLDPYKDDLPGLAGHIYGPNVKDMENAGESAKQSLLKNIKICEEMIAELEAQATE